MKNVILCDLDGTLANIEHRLKYIKGPGKKDWDKFHTECVNDSPNWDVIDILYRLEGRNCGCGGRVNEVYILSGRNSVVREETVRWLQENVDEFWDYDTRLVMRKANDRRPDTVVKKEMVDKLGLTPKDVLCVLDDRQCVVDMWRENGFRCLQVQAWTE